jgi:hypothetical protein
VDLERSVILGVVFGLLAAACAFVISYAEYKRNWSFRGSASKMALSGEKAGCLYLCPQSAAAASHVTSAFGAEHEKGSPTRSVGA